MLGCKLMVSLVLISSISAFTIGSIGDSITNAIGSLLGDNKARDELYELSCNQLQWISSSGAVSKEAAYFLVISAGIQLCLKENTEFKKVGKDVEILLAIIDSVKARLSFDPEVERFYCPEKWQWVGDFAIWKTLLAFFPSSQTAEEICGENKNVAMYNFCLSDFFLKNADKAKNGKCDICEECYVATTTAVEGDQGMSIDMRNKFIILTTNVAGCNNYQSSYNMLMHNQMFHVIQQVLTLLDLAKSGKLDPAYRTILLAKIIEGAMNGFRQFLSDDVMNFVKSLINKDGSCGGKDEDAATKQLITAQVYTILFLRIKMYY